MSCFYCDDNGTCNANCTNPVIIHQCKNDECNKSFQDSVPRSSCVFCGGKTAHEEVAAIDADMCLLSTK